LALKPITPEVRCGRHLVASIQSLPPSVVEALEMLGNIAISDKLDLQAGSVHPLDGMGNGVSDPERIVAENTCADACE